MSLVRVLTGSQILLTHTFYVGETATDASGPVTVAVKRLDGTTLTSGAATKPGPAGQYTFTPPARPDPDTLLVEWTGTVGGAAATDRDYVEVAGGFLFGLGEARAQPPPLDPAKVTTAMLAAKRIEVEQECERICEQAFVPRFARVALSGRDCPDLLTPDIHLRTLRAASINGVALSAGELAAIIPLDSGVLVRARCVPWPWGHNNIVVEYEYGLDFPPEDLRTAAMQRLRSRLNLTSTGVPARAISWTAQDGGVYRISTPSKKRTGIPDVDGVYEGYSADRGGFA